MLAVNKQRFDDSQTERFGDGKIIASIPLNVFYRDSAKRLKEGDEDFTAGSTTSRTARIAHLEAACNGDRDGARSYKRPSRTI